MDKETKNAGYDEKLGFGNYIGKQIYELVVSLGGTAAGAFAGLAGAKAIFKDDDIATAIKNPISDAAENNRRMTRLENNAQEWAKQKWSKIPGLKTIPTKNHIWGAGIGSFVGLMAGGLILGYGHWKKEKQAQMQVDEITKDISDIEIFKKTDPELVAENKRLWAELKKRDEQPSSHAARVKPQHHENTSHVDAVRASQASADIAEGASVA